MPSTENIVPDKPTFGCDCIVAMNEALAPENTRLTPSWLFNSTTGARTTAIRIETEVVHKRRGARPMRVFPTYCPFCARPYRIEDAAAPPATDADADETEARDG